MCCVDVENYGASKGFGYIYIYIYRLVTNNYRLLLSWIAYIIPIITHFPIRLIYYSKLLNTLFYFLSLPHFFSTIYTNLKEKY